MKTPVARASEALTGLIARARFVSIEPLPAKAGPIGDAFDIQWMPPGRQTPNGSIDGEPFAMDFIVSSRHADICNRELQARRAQAAAGEGDIPYFDFNHDDAARSGEPELLYWAGEHPKQGGIRAKGKWSGSGKQALINRDYRRFSPQWTPNKGRGGEPLGIGVNLGGLVNRAAFQGIQSVIAKSAGLARSAAPAIHPNRFIAQARAFGFANGIINQAQAVDTFTRTAQGNAAYQQSRNFFTNMQARASAVDDVISATALPDQTHPYMALVLKLIQEQDLPPMKAALAAAVDQPAAFRDWCGQWKRVGESAPFEDILNGTQWEHPAGPQ